MAELYEARYAECGYDARTLGWHSHLDQELRFQVLCEVGQLRDTSVCDVGCGFGDLLPYLEARAEPIDYLGVDVVPTLIEEAIRRHPNGRFLCQDILDNQFSQAKDYFLLSGALNYRVEDNWAQTRETLSKIFALANVAVAVNFLSTYVNFQREHNYHHDPLDVFRFAKSLTPWVGIRHDYELWEFTVYLYKQPHLKRATSA